MSYAIVNTNATNRVSMEGVSMDWLFVVSHVHQPSLPYPTHLHPHHSRTLSLLTYTLIPTSILTAHLHTYTLTAPTYTLIRPHHPPTHSLSTYTLHTHPPPTHTFYNTCTALSCSQLTFPSNHYSTPFTHVCLSGG